MNSVHSNQQQDHPNVFDEKNDFIIYERNLFEVHPFAERNGEINVNCTVKVATGRKRFVVLTNNASERS